MNDIMIDIETLGLTADSVIVSIAAVKFNRHTGEIGDSFYQKIDPNQPGRLVCVETLKWWFNRSPELVAGLLNGDELLRDVLVELSAFFDRDRFVWSQGTDFDFPILGHAFSQQDMVIPLKYNALRDTRTVYDICNFDPKSIERQGSHHNALDDCHHQIRCVFAALKIMGVPKLKT